MKKGERVNIVGNAIFTGNETLNGCEIEIMTSDFLHERFWVPKKMVHEIVCKPVRFAAGIDPYEGSGEYKGD